jgi:protein SCO1/2
MRAPEVSKRILCLAALLVSACSNRSPLPSLGIVPQFNLTDQTGSSFSSKERLDGRLWVADFIFTNCGGPCPRMSHQMKQVRDQFNSPSEVQFVSFTVDPARDVPEVLADYAKRYEADPARWSFLTGNPAELQTLCRDAFMLGNVDGKLEHSTRFVLVDRHGRIRGFYDTSEQANVQKLIADLQGLRKDNS